ncbi:TetR/AcrR family transcriptional regulator [Streptomyces sp. NPDC052396]|uniref:TetR/AcrR family transcriptional regulator n=1 Tax=Streptomyces sp. NPDC052396 TaxID=3365689 RepID=UPI0037D7E815
MPKIVDAQARRREVAQAVQRVVSRAGSLEAASLRNVAAEAGLAIGSVRHYFTDHTELLTFAMEDLGRRIGRRVRERAEPLLHPAVDLDRRALTEELFAELLPLDDTRHQEAALWLAFTTAARTRPELRPCARELQEGLRTLIGQVLAEARRMGGVPQRLDAELESLRLAALLDGLTLQAVLYPGLVTATEMRRVLRRQLDQLTR